MVKCLVLRDACMNSIAVVNEVVLHDWVLRGAAWCCVVLRVVGHSCIDYCEFDVLKIS